MESKIKEQTDLIAIQEKFGVFEGNILITTKERVDKNLPSIATEIIDEDFAHLICNRVNNWDELIKLCKDLKARYCPDLKLLKKAEKFLETNTESKKD